MISATSGTNRQNDCLSRNSQRPTGAGFQAGASAPHWEAALPPGASAPHWEAALPPGASAPRWEAALPPSASAPLWLAVLPPLLILLVPEALAAAPKNIRLACEPRAVVVVPGEPVRVELSVQADTAAPVRIHIPAHPALMLRAVEKLPVRQDPRGFIVYRRSVIWQPLEPGPVKLDAISAEIGGRKLRFPEISITVRDPGP
jgi:hypothetical protein